MALKTRFIKIHILDHLATKLYDLSILPAGQRVRGVGNNEEVRWKAVGRIRSYKIDFNYPAQGSPFTWITMLSDTNGEVAGTPVVSGAPPRRYSYTITADLGPTAYHPARTLVIDPEVVVDDDTPPPGGSGSGSGHSASATGTTKKKHKTKRRAGSKPGPKPKPRAGSKVRRRRK